MNEEDTYKKLKGLTEEEALELHSNVYEQIYNELKLDPTKVDAGIPIGLIRERLNPLLEPYGWTFDKLLSIMIGNRDFS